jgi:short-subunit dehydrogenase
VSLVCPSLIKTKMFNGADIVNFKFLNLNLEPENVSDEIIQGILLNKEMIYLPKINYFFFVIK